MMSKYRVWFTVGWSEEDYLDVEATSVDKAYENAMNANKDRNGFDVQSIEILD